jgi:hypothetical protein
LKGIAWNNVKMLLLLLKKYFPEPFWSHLINPNVIQKWTSYAIPILLYVRHIMSMCNFQWSWKAIFKCPACSGVGTLLSHYCNFYCNSHVELPFQQYGFCCHSLQKITHWVVMLRAWFIMHLLHCHVWSMCYLYLSLLKEDSYLTSRS